MNDTQQEKAKRLIAKKQGKTPPGDDQITTRHKQTATISNFAKTTATKKYVKKRPH